MLHDIKLSSRQGAELSFSSSCNNTAAHKLRPKNFIWDNALQGNIQLFISESLQMISTHSGTRHIEWVMSETSPNGPSELMKNIRF